MVLSVLPLFVFGPWEIFGLIVVALVVFGPVGIGKKLGNLIKGTGKGVKEFKKALKEDDKESKESEESEESEE